jgi:Flp pilus assembly pilin Flp
MSFTRALVALCRGRRGATTAEYALILALVVVILIGVLNDLGLALTTKLRHIISQLGQV